MRFRLTVHGMFEDISFSLFIIDLIEMYILVKLVILNRKFRELILKNNKCKW